jgi:putative DNA methylase
VTQRRRKLIEVALPLEAIDAACKADKDRKTGTIRNLHKWFAPMPVPAWRALLFAALVDDPEDQAERERLRRLIEDLVATGSDSPPPHVIALAREEIRRSNPQGLPTIADPFCGGGSTVVEAQRLNLPSWGSDLNPVPVLISRTLCNLIPAALKAKSAANPHRLLEASLSDLRDDVLTHAKKTGERVRARISSLYPPLADGLVPYAWIWTRTAPCPNPACRLTTPLVSSWRLSAKRGAEVFARPVIADNQVEFEITDDPADAPREAKEGRASFSCVRCDTTLTTGYLREVAMRGELGLRLLAVAALKGKSRIFVAPTPAQEAALTLNVEVEPFLQVPIVKGGLGIRVPLWGMETQADLYLPRQIAALTAFADESAAVYDRCLDEGLPVEHARLIATTLGLAVSRLAMHNSKQVKWFTRNGPSKADPALREANLPIVWTFAETNPFAGSVGDWMQVVETTVRAFDSISAPGTPASIEIADARTAASQLDGSGYLVATDPPYFGHIGYADLSDYFYVWLRRALQGVHPDLFRTIAAPRAGELVANPARYGGDEQAARADYVGGFIETFASLSRIQRVDLPMLIVYAHREQEGAQGWEAMLTAVVESGLQIVGTWPVEASRSDRLRTHLSNALAAYVVLVCRPRDPQIGPVSFRDFDRELRLRLRSAVKELQEAATAPVDLAQAVIGPGMAAFSRQGAVLTADGSPLSVGLALGQINRVLSEILDEQESDFDAATRFAVAWFEEHGTAEAQFGEADQLARAKNVAVNGLVEDGIIESRPGKVKLLARAELDPQWDPASDGRLTVWEVTQHLVKRLEDGGDLAAADLLHRVGGRADAARELTYRLYSICERKGWTREAQGYNALAASWTEIQRLASEASVNPVQPTLGV